MIVKRLWRVTYHYKGDAQVREVYIYATSRVSAIREAKKVISNNIVIDTIQDFA
jgi:hypothetical protein